MSSEETEVEADGPARRSIGARRSPASQEAILAAAQDILNEQGFRGFSIEAVARRARAGKPTIYRWWPTKAKLLLDVYQRQKRNVIFADQGPLEEDLYRFLDSLLTQWRDSATGEIFRSFIAEAQSDPDAAKALADYSAERRRHTAQIIQRAVDRGEAAAATDTEMVADMIAAYAWTRLLTGRLDADEPSLRRAVGQLVNGIRR